MRRSLLFALFLAVLGAAFMPRVEAQQACFGPTCPSGGGTTTIVSGGTPITGGATTQLCFNDAAFISCGDAGLTYNKTTDFLSVAGGIINGSVSTAGRGILTIRDTITGASATSNFLNITGAFPATLSAATTGIDISIAADNDNQDQVGLKVAVTGTGAGANGTTAIWGSSTNTGIAPFGVMGSSTGATAGRGTGVYGYSTGGTSNVGGFFGLGFVSAGATNVALVADNAAVAANIFEARDNSTPVFTIADGGGVTATQRITATGGVTFGAGGNNNLMSLDSNFYIGGASSGNNGLFVYSSLTPDSSFLGAGSTSNVWHLAETADVAFDFNAGACGTSACTDPALIVHSAVQDTTQYNHLSVTGSSGGPIKALTESSATTVFGCPAAALRSLGCEVRYHVEACDATDCQTRSGRTFISGTNKAGTMTCAVANAAETTDGSTYVSSTGAGTLTYGITATTGTAECIFNLNAVASLTQTSLNVQYQVNNLGPGQVTRK